MGGLDIGGRGDKTFGKREHWGEGEWYIDIGERGRGWEALVLQKM